MQYKGRLIIKLEAMVIGVTETIRQSDYKLIIFDCDGTLVNSEHLSNRVIATMLQALGLPMTAEQAFELFNGKSFKDITTYIAEHQPDYQMDFEAQFRVRVKQVFEQELQPIPGVIDFIKKLALPYCIASNAPQEKMAVTLPICNLSDYFSAAHIFSAYDLQKWKPEPELFLHAAEYMGAAISDCLVIEDSISGAQAAVNAGMDVIVYSGDASVRFGLENIPVFHSYDQLSSSFFSS